MADTIATDDKVLWELIKRTEPFAEPERSGTSQDRHVPRCIPIVAGLSALCWAAIMLVLV